MKPAFGAISMLLALVIIAVIFIIMVPVFRTTTSANFSKSSVKQENVEKRVDELVKEIQTRKQQSLEYYNNMQD